MLSILRLRKCVRELANDKVRTFIVVLAIAVGIIGAGTMINSYLILSREINTNYIATNPASFTLWSDDAVAVRNLINGTTEVKDAELRRVVSSRILLKSGEWRTLILYAVEDISNSRVNTFRLEEGRLPSKPDEIVLERDAVGVANASLGGTIIARLPNNSTKPVRITGFVHAAGLPPASMENLVYGFVAKSTLEYLGTQHEFNQVNVVIAGNNTNIDDIYETARKLTEVCRNNGYRVGKWKIHQPGVHPHATQLNSFLFLLQIFGILALLLSGMLVINMITSMLAGQIRQIGVMKAIGASSLQIASLYYMIVLFLGAFALLFAIPTAYYLGTFFADFAANKLNFNITSYAVPAWSFFVQIAIGLIIPALTASYPIIKGSRVTVRQAITDYGIAKAVSDKGFFDKLMEGASGLSRPVLLSIRNAFRKKDRLILTLIALSFGGAVFILALNVNASIGYTVKRALGDLAYDIKINFNDSYDTDTLLKILSKVDGTSHAEVWASTDVEITGTKDGRNFYFNLKGIPSDSQAFVYPLVKGRRLTATDNRKILVSHKLAMKLSNAEVGDTVQLLTNGQKQVFEIAGVVTQIAAGTEAFINDDALKALIPRRDYISEAYVKIRHDDMQRQTDVFNRMERILSKEGFEIRSSLNINLFRKAFLDHLEISIALLLTMAGLIIVIGGIGLTSTISMNVMDRIREIGVMRSIGASNRAILWIFVGESIVVGLISWILSTMLSIPLTIFVGKQFGMIFIQTALDIVVSPEGALMWSVFVVIIATIAALYPAKKAYSRPVREALAYE